MWRLFTFDSKYGATQRFESEEEARYWAKKYRDFGYGYVLFNPDGIRVEEHRICHCY